MNDNYIRNQAREDFYKLRGKGILNELMGIIVSNEHNKLLSFYDIRSLLGDTKEETYLGLREIPIEKIIGSEGRYQDFTRSFLPKARHLQERWVSISSATQKNIILPPIQLFKVGDAYFVRDGNHRVSVARASGVKMIDAEVIQVASNIYVSPDMTLREILQRVIQYEWRSIFKETRLANYIDTTHLVVTSPGSYSLLIQHVMNHKHFMEQERKAAEPQGHQLEKISQINPVLAELDDTLLSFGEAAQSWYESLFKPILKLIREHGLLAQFPERTAADLYIWLISHWEELKKLHGDDVPLEDAVISYSKQIPLGFWQQTLRFFAKKRQPKSPS